MVTLVVILLWPTWQRWACQDLSAGIYLRPSFPSPTSHLNVGGHYHTLTGSDNSKAQKNLGRQLLCFTFTAGEQSVLVFACECRSVAFPKKNKIKLIKSFNMRGDPS